MTTEKAAQWFEHYIDNDHYTSNFQEACKLAVVALRDQAERQENPEEIPEVCGGGVKMGVEDREKTVCVMEHKEKTVCILGTVYTIKEQSESENERLSECDGYCDWTTKEIVVEREVNGTLKNMDVYVRKVLRHEIVHAFLVESGLNECSGSTEIWARNETMVDWIARQGPKIYEAWKAAGALDG